MCDDVDNTGQLLYLSSNFAINKTLLAPIEMGSKSVKITLSQQIFLVSTAERQLSLLAILSHQRSAQALERIAVDSTYATA